MDIEAVQRRTFRVLILGQLAATVELWSSVTVGAFGGQQILGQTTPKGGNLRH